MHINFSMRSCETKIGITLSGDNVNHVVSILFVAIYPISCSDEFVNHS